MCELCLDDVIGFPKLVSQCYCLCWYCIVYNKKAIHFVVLSLKLNWRIWNKVQFQEECRITVGYYNQITFLMLSVLFLNSMGKICAFRLPL